MIHLKIKDQFISVSADGFDLENTPTTHEMLFGAVSVDQATGTITLLVAEPETPEGRALLVTLIEEFFG